MNKEDFREEVEGIIQLMDTETLIDVSTGRINLRLTAKNELLSRGYNLDGSRG